MAELRKVRVLGDNLQITGCCDEQWLSTPWEDTADRNALALIDSLCVKLNVWKDRMAKNLHMGMVCVQ